MRVWLASGSPRRRQILQRLGFEVVAQPSYVDETREPGEDPVVYAVRLAMEKASVAPEQEVVIAADTVVHRGQDVFDKPDDRSVARAHLQALSGDWHQVTTGVCVRRGADVVCFASTTSVRFRDLDAAEIEAYLATGEADDKAGAYGIQGDGGVLVAEVRGSWTNVMGLPAEDVVDPLVARGATRWRR